MADDKKIRELIRNSNVPDHAEWINRFKVASSSSKATYTISQHRQKRHWGCSCRGWTNYRKCKHLAALGLPCFSVPYEVGETDGKKLLVVDSFDFTTPDGGVFSVSIVRDVDDWGESVYNILDENDHPINEKPLYLQPDFDLAYNVCREAEIFD